MTERGKTKDFGVQAFSSQGREHDLLALRRENGYGKNCEALHKIESYSSFIP